MTWIAQHHWKLLVGNDRFRLPNLFGQIIQRPTQHLSQIDRARLTVLLTAQLGAAGPTTGSTILLDSVAAIVIGGTALSGGVGGVGRTVLGVLILTVLSNGLNQIGAADYTQTVIKGLVIIVAAVFTMASQRKLIVK